jgi:hypothetical protein
METIKKKVSLEPYYSRQKSVIPFAGMSEDEFYPGLNWGKIAYGVDFTKMSADDVRLYGNGIKKLGKLTFQELMEEYHRVKNNQVPYKENPTPEDNEEYEKLRSIVAFVEAKRVIDPPAPTPDPCCNPCAVPTPPIVYEMDPYGDPYFPPTFSMSVCLVQSSNIVGAYTFATKDWVAGKRYFAGDKVIYDGKTFKLKEFTNTNKVINSSETNCQGQPVMPGVRFYTATSIDEFAGYDPAYEGLSDSIFEEFVVTSESEIVDLGYIYAKIRTGENQYRYYVRPSWGGFNNSYDGKLYFDSLLTPYEPERGFKMISQYETEHWAVDDVILSHGAYTIDTCGEGLTISGKQTRDIGYGDNEMVVRKMTNDSIQWESKLPNFKRNTKTVTAEGVELPGRLPNAFESTILDLQYVAGTVKNVDTTGEIVIGDYLAKITIKTDDGQTVTLNHGDCLEDFSQVHSWASPSDGFAGGKEGNITFEYYIGAELDLENPDDPDSNYTYINGDKGVVYNDTLRFVARYAIENIEGRDAGLGFVYIDIDYANTKRPVVYENIDNYHDDVILSNVTATTKSMMEGGEPVSPDFQNAVYIMEDYQLGLAFVTNNNENVYVDRGNATAFERHMRLSEVDTLQDLENYGNGMFKMKE